MGVHFTCRTSIAASAADVFAASVSIDAHLNSMSASKEQAIAGVTTGRIGLGESVTWRARHFGIVWTMTSRITQFEEPTGFVDEQERGPFAKFRHVHNFIEVPGGTLMEDEVAFTAPLGPLGWVAERLALSWYLPRLIRSRNAYLKASLET
jgi:ligand-binding SRPBCC domain-containing protein